MSEFEYELWDRVLHCVSYGKELPMGIMCLIIYRIGASY
jgi:hypothetical protein